MSEGERQRLVSSLAGFLAKGSHEDIVERVIGSFRAGRTRTTASG